MKLKDLLGKKPLLITYRTIHPQYGDVYFGTCVWDGKKLITYDRDECSVEDEMIDYEFTTRKGMLPDDLTVWYTSRGIEG